MPVDALEEARAALARVRAAQQREQRMRVEHAPALDERERQRRRRLRDEPHGAVHDRVALEALAGERRIVARRPQRPPGDVDGDRRSSARGLRLGRAAEAGEEVEHAVQTLLIIVAARFRAPRGLASVAAWNRGSAMWNLVYTIGRVLLVALFIKSGVEKLIDPTGLTGMLSRQGLPDADARSPISPAWPSSPSASSSRSAGRPGIAAFGLIAFTIVATLLAHNYWDMTGAARRANETAFWKNLAIIGGLLMLMASGAGRFSVDRR